MRFQEKLFYGIIDRRKEYKREMEKTNRKYQAYIQILKEELHPAMGCTEPIALAYAAAVARRELGCLPDRVVIGASGSIIKNVKSVIVPNTNHLKGIPAAGRRSGQRTGSNCRGDRRRFGKNQRFLREYTNHC